jgi:hypothetical protein
LFGKLYIRFGTTGEYQGESGEDGNKVRILERNWFCISLVFWYWNGELALMDKTHLNYKMK